MPIITCPHCNEYYDTEYDAKHQTECGHTPDNLKAAEDDNQLTRHPDDR